MVTSPCTRFLSANSGSASTALPVSYGRPYADRYEVVWGANGAGHMLSRKQSLQFSRLDAQMGAHMSQHQQHSTWLAAHEADLSAYDIWFHYYSIGGNLDVFEVDAYLHGVCPLPIEERNTIALALNELIDDLPQRRRAEFVYDPTKD